MNILRKDVKQIIRHSMFNYKPGAAAESRGDNKSFDGNILSGSVSVLDVYDKRKNEINYWCRF